MNVAALLQENPSDHRRREQQHEHQSPQQQQQQQQQPAAAQQGPSPRQQQHGRHSHSPLHRRQSDASPSPQWARTPSNASSSAPAPLNPPASTPTPTPTTGARTQTWPFLRAASPLPHPYPPHDPRALPGPGVPAPGMLPHTHARTGSAAMRTPTPASPSLAASAYHHAPPPPSSPRIFRGPASAAPQSSTRAGSPPPPAHQPVPMVMPPLRAVLSGDPAAQQHFVRSPPPISSSSSSNLTNPTSNTNAHPNFQSQSQSAPAFGSGPGAPAPGPFGSISAGADRAPGGGGQGGCGGHVTPGAPGPLPTHASPHQHQHHHQTQTHPHIQPPPSLPLGASHSPSVAYSPRLSQAYPPQRQTSMDGRSRERDLRERERDVRERDIRERDIRDVRERDLRDRDVRDRERERDARDMRDRDPRDVRERDPRDRERPLSMGGGMGGMGMGERRRTSGASASASLVGPGGAFVLDKPTTGLLASSSSSTLTSLPSSSSGLPPSSSSASMSAPPPPPALGGSSANSNGNGNGSNAQNSNPNPNRSPNNTQHQTQNQPSQSHSQNQSPGQYQNQSSSQAYPRPRTPPMAPMMGPGPGLERRSSASRSPVARRSTGGPANEDVVMRDVARDARDPRDGRDARDGRDVRDVRDIRDVRDARDVRDVRDPRDTRDTLRDIRDNDPHDIREFTLARDRNRDAQLRAGMLPDPRGGEWEWARDRDARAPPLVREAAYDRDREAARERLERERTEREREVKAEREHMERAERERAERERDREQRERDRERDRDRERERLPGPGIPHPSARSMSGAASPVVPLERRDSGREREREGGMGMHAPTPTEVFPMRERMDRDRIALDRERADRERERVDRERERKDREWHERLPSSSSSGAGPSASGHRPSSSGSYPGPGPSPLLRSASAGAGASSSSGIGGPGAGGGMQAPPGSAPRRDASREGLRDVRDAARDPSRDAGRREPLSAAHAHPYLHPQGHLPHQHPHQHPSHSHVHPSVVHPGYERDRDRDRERERVERERERERVDRERADRERVDRERERDLREREREREQRGRERDAERERESQSQRERELHAHHASAPPSQPHSRQASIAPPPTSAPQQPQSQGPIAIPGPPPQQQFQNRFHTQFVSGLAQPQRMEAERGDRERDRDRDRDRERERAAGGSRMGSPVPALLPGGMVVGPGMGLGEKRERDRSSVGGGGKVGPDDTGRMERERDRNREAGREKGREKYALAMMGAPPADMRDMQRERARDDGGGGGYGTDNMGMSYAPRMHPVHVQQQQQQPQYHQQYMTQGPHHGMHPGDAMLVDDHPQQHYVQPQQPPSMHTPYGGMPGQEFGHSGHGMHPRDVRHRDQRDIEMLDAHDAPQMAMHGGPPPPPQRHSRGPSGGGGGAQNLGMPPDDGAWYDPYPRDPRAGERDHDAYQDARHAQQVPPHQHAPLAPAQDVPLHMPQDGGDANGTVDAYGAAEDESADEWEEWLVEADERAQRARVRVDLGTWVYPNVPFPYFFELGGGLVGMKEREEERERQKKEKEHVEKEKRAIEEAEARRREWEEKAKAKEELERKEKERKAKEDEERERKAKEAAEAEKKEKEKPAAKVQSDPSVETMEEGEIDEEEENALETAAKAKEEAKKEQEKETQRIKAEKERELQGKEKAASKEKTLAEQSKHSSPTNLRPPFLATVSSGTTEAAGEPRTDEDQDPIIIPPFLDRETRTTILIPSGYIPLKKPLRPRLWGGGGVDVRPRPSVPLRRMSSKRGLKSAATTSSSTKRPRPGVASRKGSGIGGLTASNSNMNGNSTAPSRAASLPALRRTRRVYTDDSDIFLCAIHAGWLTWSGARKARARGRDLRIDVRVLRCAGAGAGSIFARGVGQANLKTTPAQGGMVGPIAPALAAAQVSAVAGDPDTVREEMVGRFVGGYGERCFNPLGRTGRIASEEGEDGLYDYHAAHHYGFGDAVDAVLDGPGALLADSDVGQLLPQYDDPEDDGRSLRSASWGTGHDGSAIEIVGVEFVERGAAHKAPGVGRRNRAQRLREYAERRASVLGLGTAPMSACTLLAGRKRRRGWDGWPVQPHRTPNATTLDVILEEGNMDEEEQSRSAKRLKTAPAEGKLMDVRTMVFGVGAGGDLRVGYKYMPELLKNILFPSQTSLSVDVSLPSRRKRRWAQEVEDVDMADPGSLPTTSRGKILQGTQTNLVRPVILETAKESYLLSSSAPAADSTDELLSSARSYEIALILETEVVVEEEPVSASTENPGDKENSQSIKQSKEAENIGEHIATQDVAAAKENNDAEDILTVSAGDERSGTAASSVPDISVPAPSEKQPSPPPSSSLAVASTAAFHSRLTTPPPRSISPVHSPDFEPKEDAPPSSPYTYGDQSLVEETENEGKTSMAPVFAVQVLQRNMTESMFRFASEGVYVKDGSSGSKDDGPMDTEWVIQVKNWKWAAGNWKGVRERD